MFLPASRRVRSSARQDSFRKLQCRSLAGQDSLHELRFRRSEGKLGSARLRFRGLRGKGALWRARVGRSGRERRRPGLQRGTRPHLLVSFTIMCETSILWRGSPGWLRGCGAPHKMDVPSQMVIRHAPHDKPAPSSSLSGARRINVLPRAWAPGLALRQGALQGVRARLIGDRPCVV